MRRWIKTAFMLSVLPLFLQASRGYVPEEADPAQGTVWDLRPLFKDTAAWDKEREQVEAALPGLAALKGAWVLTPSRWGRRWTESRPSGNGCGGSTRTPT